MDLSSFRKGGHLHNVEEQLPDETKEESEFLVLLKNFEFSPSFIEAKVGSSLTVRVEQNKRDFSDLYQARAFILAVEQLEIQSPPLNLKDSWTFRVEKQGRYEVVCLNYCKLSFHISITPAEQVKSVFPPQQEAIQENNEIQIKQGVKDRFQAFTYEEFQNLICSQEIATFDQIPQYLLRCFKTELCILEKTKPQQSHEQAPRPKISSTVCREHSTNTQQCSAYEQFDESRRASPGRYKALTTFFEEDERGELQSRALKKTSSQVINLQWKQWSAKKEREPSQTFEQQVQSFVRGKEGKILIPSSSETINSVLVLLQNRARIIEYIG